MPKYLLFLLLVYTSVSSQNPNVSSQTNTQVLSDTAAKPLKLDSVKVKAGDTILVPQQENFEQSQNLIIKIEEDKRFEIWSVLIPIFSLVLGVFLDRWSNRWTEKKLMKKSGKRWVAELRSLEEPIKKQITALTTMKSQLEKEVHEPPNLTIITGLDCQVFNSMDKSQLLRFIELEKSKFMSQSNFQEVVKISNNIHGFISIMANNHDSLVKKFNEFLMGISKHTTSLSENLQILCREFAHYGNAIIQQGQDPTRNPYFKVMDDLFASEILPKMETGDYDIYVLRDTFFTPLKSALINLRSDNRTIKISDSVSKCLNDIAGIVMEKRYMTENLSILISRYGDGLEELPSVIKNLEPV